MDRRPRRRAVAGRRAHRRRRRWPSDRPADPGRPGGLRHQQLGAHHRAAARPPGPGRHRRRRRTTWSRRPGWRRRCSSRGNGCTCWPRPACVEALDERGVEIADGGRRDAAVVGWSRDFDFAALAAVAAVARETGRLIATNERPDPPDARGPAAGFRGAAGRGGHRVGRRPRRWPASPNPPMVEYIRAPPAGPTGDRRR